jgi:hypothetical protein
MLAGDEYVLGYHLRIGSTGTAVAMIGAEDPTDVFSELRSADRRADCRHPQIDQSAGYSRTIRSAGIACRFHICLRKSAAPVSLH